MQLGASTFNKANSPKNVLLHLYQTVGGGWSRVLKEKKRKTSLVNGSAKLSRSVFAEMWILIWPILIPTLSAFPVFTFNGTTASSAGPSFAYLDKDLQLPGKFILCSSVKQAKFDNIGFYSVSRRDSQEWIKLKIENFVKTTRLIIYWKGNFHKLGKPISPKIDLYFCIYSINRRNTYIPVLYVILYRFN